MRSEKFIQLFTSEGKQILGSEGVLNYDKRIKKPENIIKSLKDQNKIPAAAAKFAIHKTLLNSIIKLTERYDIETDTTINKD